MSLAFTFPGQGSQTVGMGRSLADAFRTARDTFAEVDEALQQNLSKIMFEGPPDELTLTENAQPALMAVSMAVVNVLRIDGKLDLPSTAMFVAGHSLGEYSAHAAVSTFGLGDTARLLKTRGQAMQAAVKPGLGAMAAILGLEFEAVAAIALEAAGSEVCQAANDNGGGQVVISGHKAAVERAMELAKAKGAKRAIALPVSAPFHCSLMEPAANVMADALARVKVSRPLIPVIANVTAQPVSDPAQIVAHLVTQVTGTVRWRECMSAMAGHGVSRFVELGSGKVLTGLVKRIVPDAESMAVGTAEDIEAFLKTV